MMGSDASASTDVSAAGVGPSRLAAVVVTHNRKPQLQRTLRQLLAAPVDHLVVVDNGSTDGSRDWLAALDDPRLCIILAAQNNGGAGGFERGLREAVARFDPDWCLVMDDDARPLPGAIAAFRRIDTAGWEAFAAAVYYPDGDICEMNRPSRNPFWHGRSFLRTLAGGGRGGFHVSDADYARDAITAVDAASFVGLFVSRAAIARVGYPDGRLFIYGDDVLYTLELTARGGRIGFLPQVRFEHDCSTFRRGDKQVHRPLWKTYYHHRNLMFVYRKAAGPVLFWPILLLVLPKWALKARNYGADARPYLRLLRVAVGDGLRYDRSRQHRQVRALARLGQKSG